jgi:glycosyltransferase involved in cell wall biosynthesis
VHVRGFQTEPVTSAWSDSVAKVIAVSDAVADSLPKAIAPSRIVTVHDPVDIDLVDKSAGARDRIRAELGILDGDIAVGIFGRVIPWKGQLEFAQALIPAMRAEPAIKAVIVGDESDGAREYLEGIRKYVDEAGMTHRFILAGYRRNVEDFYAAMNIVVHASIAPEPFGMVVPEAMAASRPVIASKAGGPLEVVDHGIDGLLFEPGNTEALTEAVLRLARDPALCESMAASGREKVLNRLSITTNARTIAGIYADVLSLKRVGSVASLSSVPTP